MVDTPNSLSGVLSCILTCSNEYLNSRPQSTSSESTHACIDIDLPEPPALLPALVAAGARPEIAQAMQAAYHQRACEFREQALTMISRACSKLAQLPSTSPHTSDGTIIAAFQQVYLKKLNSWISEGVALLQDNGPSVLRCREDSERVPGKISNKAFNHQYVPLLEHFFEENPFPTHADKVFLAKKSSMTYRQIHVWFQNRRNRTKKAFHKKPISEGATIPLDTLMRKMGKFAVPPATKIDAPPSTRNSPDTSAGVYNVLDGHFSAPRHAFPTTYPPSYEYNPLPTVPTFTTLEWPREPTLSSGRPCQFVIDVDELTDKFSRLNVWDDSVTRSRRVAGKMVYEGSAATSAITVKPSSAPHPACIRTTVVPPPPRLTFPTVLARASSLHVFKSSGSKSTMTSLIPTPRKFAPLPKHIPSKPPFAGISDREILQSSISSPPHPPYSRSSSLSSEASQDSMATYGWSSSSSSAVTTPETSSSPLSPT